jgi:hypothetical protein
MIALDTNVLLYACDRADSRRQQISPLISLRTAGMECCSGKWPASSSRLLVN